MNISLSSVRKPFAVLSFAAVALVTGCDEKDGRKELAEAKAAVEVRDFAKAARLAEKSLAYAESNVDALLLLTQARLELGDVAAAQEAVARAEALAAGDSDVRLFGAQVAWHAKDYARAQKLFASVAEDNSLEAATRADAWVGRGIVEMTCNEFDLARVAFLRAIRLDRRNPSAWYHLGILYRDGFGYFEIALDTLNVYVRLQEDATPRVQKVQRTVIPELKDQIARAAADRPGAAKCDSSASAAAMARAEALLKKGTAKDLKAARKAYEDALAVDSRCYPAALGLAKLWPRIDTTKEGLQKSLQNYGIACSLRPSAISAFLAAGALASRLGQHANAVKIYSRAIAADPTKLEAIDGFIRSLGKVGNKRKVAAAYQAYRDSLAVPRKK